MTVLIRAKLTNSDRIPQVTLQVKSNTTSESTNDELIDDTK